MATAVFHELPTDVGAQNDCRRKSEEKNAVAFVKPKPKLSH